MAKLIEKNGAEMMSALANIAVPLKRFLDDEEFDRAWKQATKKGLKTGMTDILRIYADLAPIVLGDKHLKDTIAILAVIEGTTATKMLKMDGTELIGDVIKAFKEQIQPFLLRLGLSVGVQQ